MVDIQKQFEQVFGKGFSTPRRPHAAHHGMLWIDNTINKCKVRCDRCNTWHLKIEVKPECELGGVLHTMPSA